MFVLFFTQIMASGVLLIRYYRHNFSDELTHRGERICHRTMFDVPRQNLTLRGFARDRNGNILKFYYFEKMLLIYSIRLD